MKMHFMYIFTSKNKSLAKIFTWITNINFNTTQCTSVTRKILLISLYKVIITKITFRNPKIIELLYFILDHFFTTFES